MRTAKSNGVRFIPNGRAPQDDRPNYSFIPVTDKSMKLSTIVTRIWASAKMPSSSAFVHDAFGELMNPALIPLGFALASVKNLAKTPMSRRRSVTQNIPPGLRARSISADTSDVLRSSRLEYRSTSPGLFPCSCLPSCLFEKRSHIIHVFLGARSFRLVVPLVMMENCLSRHPAFLGQSLHGDCFMVPSDLERRFHSLGMSLE